MNASSNRWSAWKLLLLPLLAALAGCATLPQQLASAGQSNAQEISLKSSQVNRQSTKVAESTATLVPVDTIVAIDLVSVLMQLPDFAPFYTTMQFSKPRTPFGLALRKAMRQSGFGVQMVPQDQGIHYVSYATRVVTAEGGETMEYVLKIKDLEIQRRYRLDPSYIYPLSEVIVSGVAPSKVIVNDEIYVKYAGGSGFPTGVTFLDEDGKVAEQNTTLTKTRRNARVSGESINNEHYLVLAKASIFTVNRIQGRASNAYHKDRYHARKQLTVRFRAGRLSLGSANKLGIRKMLNAFEPSTDVYTITGCSHGRSLMFDGTEIMALSRSQRVKEELLAYGVKQDNVREEGCFQTEYGESLPPNGVIITHKRRNEVRS